MAANPIKKIRASEEPEALNEPHGSSGGRVLAGA